MNKNIWTATLVMVNLFSLPVYSQKVADASNTPLSGPCLGYTVNATPADTIVCNTAVQLNAVASTTTSIYNWAPLTGLSDPGIANPVVDYAFDQQFVVFALDTINGCVATDTVVISAYNNYNDIALHCGSGPVTITLPANGDSYNWFSFIDSAGNAFPLTGTAASFQANQSGTYAGTVVFNGCSANGYFIVVDTCTATPYVWPGDCNYDQVTNNLDLLYIGLAYLATGPGRQSQSTSWQPWPCNNWTNSFINTANFKHADCNGDGAVEIPDTVAISQNYGMTHPFRQPAMQFNSANADLQLVANKDTAGLNEWIYFDLVAGGPQVVDSLYGFTFILNFDPLLLDLSQTSISYTPSVMGTINTDLHSLTMNFSSVGRIEAALCRIDHTNAINLNGIIGTLAVKTAGNITAVSLLEMYLTNVNAVTRGQSQVILNLVPDTVIIDPNFTSIGEPVSPAEFQVYPNPANDELFVMSDRLTGNVVMEIMDPVGKVVMKKQVPGNEFSLLPQSFNVRHLGSGIYSIRISTAGAIHTEMFVKQ